MTMVRNSLTSQRWLVLQTKHSKIKKSLKCVKQNFRSRDIFILNIEVIEVCLIIVHIKNPGLEAYCSFLLFSLRACVLLRNWSRDQKVSKTNIKMATVEDFFGGQPLDLLIAFLDTEPFDNEIEIETTEVN